MGVPSPYPIQDHIPQLLPGHRDLGPGTAGAEVSASMSNAARDTAVANPNIS